MNYSIDEHFETISDRLVRLRYSTGFEKTWHGALIVGFGVVMICAVFFLGHDNGGNWHDKGGNWFAVSFIIFCEIALLKHREVLINLNNYIILIKHSVFGFPFWEERLKVNRTDAVAVQRWFRREKDEYCHRLVLVRGRKKALIQSFYSAIRRDDPVVEEIGRTVASMLNISYSGYLN